MGDSGRLTAAQRRLLAAMLEARNLREAAQSAGVAEGSARRWMRSERFQAALTSELDGLLDHASVNLAADLGKARAALVAVLDSKTASDTSKIRAAAVVLDAGLRVYEMRQLAKRVTALEESLLKGGDGNG